MAPRALPQTHTRRKPANWRTKGRKAATPLARAVARWSAATAVLAVLAAIYELHPYYQGLMFEPWHPFMRVAMGAWLVAGIPYVKVTTRRFGGMRMDLTDGAMHYLLWLRGVWWWANRQARWPGHIWRNRRMRVTVLSLGVKAFFTPLMMVFMTGHAGNISGLWMKTMGVKVPSPEAVRDMWHNGAGAVVAYVTDLLPRLVPTAAQMGHVVDVGSWSRKDFWWVADLYYQLLFLVDCTWALTGYAAESRWLGNKTKSVEPTGFGWFVALMCYPPFNGTSGVYIPLGRGPSLFGDESLMMACRLIMLLAFTVYVAATLAFGPTFSNLTNRGIITRGPYRFVRHPAYAAKNLAWWMEFLPWASLGTCLALVGWNIVYGLRAWTEERHLGRDPAYREYRQKVRWAFIPGIW